MTSYAIVIERAERNFAAYVPDLPGVIATGDTIEETRKAITEAIALYREEAQRAGEPLTPPSASVEIVEVA